MDLLSPNTGSHVGNVQRPGGSLHQCFRTQIRVISALIRREMLTRYGRHNIGFLWVFGEPMLFTMGVTTLWNITGHDYPGGISITAFILTGYSAVLLWRNMPNRAISALAPSKCLMFHAQVKLIDVYLARLILEAAGATGSLFALTLLFFGIGLVEPPRDYLLAALGWGLLAWYAVSISLLAGALAERSEIVDRVWHIFQYLMIPLSGSFFLADSIPDPFRSILLLNPTVNCTEMFRAGFFGDVYVWHYDIQYTVIVNSILFLLGLSQVRHVARTMIAEA